MAETTERDDSVAELVSRAAEQASHLVRDEIRLATAEVRQSARNAGAGAGLLGGAGLFAVLALVTLTGAAVAAFALVVDVWLAALIVGAIHLLLAGAAALVGRARLKRVGPPEQTIDNVRLDVAAIKGGSA